jgi:hypothetical protein
MDSACTGFMNWSRSNKGTSSKRSGSDGSFPSRGFKALTPIVGTLVILLAVVGCASTTNRPAQQDPMAVTIRWLPGCSAGNEQAFFTLVLEPNGSAHFVGIHQTRILGRIEVLVDAARATAIRQAAKTAVRKADTQAAEMDPFASPRSELCMDVTQGDSSTAAGERMTVRSKVGKHLLDEIVRAVPLRRWVCPSRRADEYPRIRNRDVCEDQYNVLPALMASYRDPAACGGFHSIDVYDDGTMYYFATVAGMGGKHRTVAEQYIEISPAELHELYRLVATFDFKHSRFPNSATEDEAKQRHLTNDPSSLQRFKAAVTAEGRIQFVTISEVSQSCSPAWERAMKYPANLYVRFGLDLPSNTP